MVFLFLFVITPGRYSEVIATLIRFQCFIEKNDGSAKLICWASGWVLRK